MSAATSACAGHCPPGPRRAGSPIVKTCRSWRPAVTGSTTPRSAGCRADRASRGATSERFPGERPAIAAGESAASGPSAAADDQQARGREIRDDELAGPPRETLRPDRGPEPRERADAWSPRRSGAPAAGRARPGRGSRRTRRGPSASRPSGTWAAARRRRPATKPWAGLRAIRRPSSAVSPHEDERLREAGRA